MKTICILNSKELFEKFSKTYTFSFEMVLHSINYCNPDFIEFLLSKVGPFLEEIKRRIIFGEVSDLVKSFYFFEKYVAQFILDEQTEGNVEVLMVRITLLFKYACLENSYEVIDYLIKNFRNVFIRRHAKNVIIRNIFYLKSFDYAMNVLQYLNCDLKMIDNAFTNYFVDYIDDIDLLDRIFFSGNRKTMSFLSKYIKSYDSYYDLNYIIVYLIQQNVEAIYTISKTIKRLNKVNSKKCLLEYIIKKPNHRKIYEIIFSIFGSELLSYVPKSPFYYYLLSIYQFQLSYPNKAILTNGIELGGDKSLFLIPPVQCVRNALEWL